jgi:DNA-binding response OmpR family regulator
MEFRQAILLVDNEERTIDLLRLILEGEGFIVHTAYCGEAALGRIHGIKYAVAILDYALPDMKGDYLAERIRVESPETGIIMLTGFMHAIDPAKLSKFSYVFEKPVNPREILAALKLMMRVPKQMSRQII